MRAPAADWNTGIPAPLRSQPPLTAALGAGAPALALAGCLPMAATAAGDPQAHAAGGSRLEGTRPLAPQVNDSRREPAIECSR